MYDFHMKFQYDMLAAHASFSASSCLKREATFEHAATPFLALQGGG
jgi:hypothetical protein